MKNYIVSALALLISVTLSIGQVVTTTKPYSSFLWDVQIIAMEEAQTDLHNSHGSPQYQSFVFRPSTPSFFVDDDPIFNNAPFVAGDQYFRQVDNPDFFTFFGDLPVGFFGHEAGDNNKLGFNEYDVNDNVIGSTQLFEHFVDNAPSSVLLTANGVGKIAFTHDNPIKGVKTQEATERFVFFREYDPTTFEDGNSWVITIDDRENSLIDFDDGLFYLRSDTITPVPEPASVGMLALASLFGVMILKRKLASRSIKE